jgi:hypothetical protein
MPFTIRASKDGETIETVAPRPPSPRRVDFSRQAGLFRSLTMTGCPTRRLNLINFFHSIAAIDRSDGRQSLKYHADPAFLAPNTPRFACNGIRQKNPARWGSKGGPIR